MAWFHFCTANHHATGKATLDDMANWFEAGLLDLGHTVTFSRTSVERSAINLFWEYFEPGMAAKLHDAGIEYGIIATEIPDGAGFNWRKEPEWLARFQGFSEAAQHARFIWTMVESTVPYYARFCPTAFIELGFSRRLIPAQAVRLPTVDFCFFGLRTPYREEVVERLRQYARVEWPQHFLTAAGVSELIANSKIGLNFKQSPQWPIPSPTRLGRLMMAQRAVAAEYVPLATRQGEIAGICPETTPLHEYALSIFEAGWKQKADTAFAQYEAQMPMASIMENVLDSTLPAARAQHAPQRVPLQLLPPILVSENSLWNFVCWGDTYFALKKSLGQVDVTLGLAALLDLYPKGIQHAGDLEEVLRLADQCELSPGPPSSQ